MHIKSKRMEVFKPSVFTGLKYLKQDYTKKTGKDTI